MKLIFSYIDCSKDRIQLLVKVLKEDNVYSTIVNIKQIMKYTLDVYLMKIGAVT
jgi:hypothetical protein